MALESVPMSLRNILAIKVIPDDATTRNAARVFLAGIVPAVVLLGALQWAMATAKTPFEEFLGVAVSVGLGLLWTIFSLVLIHFGPSEAGAVAGHGIGPRSGRFGTLLRGGAAVSTVDRAGNPGA